MNLSWPLRTSFEDYLQYHCTQPVRIRWHRNRHTMISLTQMKPIGWKVSIHYGFSTAPESVQRALATYLNTRRKDAWSIVRQFAETIPIPARGHELICHTEGVHHNLAAIQKCVEDQFFEKQSLARITWKTYRKSSHRKKRRSIRYGQYDPMENLILIHDL